MQRIETAGRFYFLLESEKLNPLDKQRYKKLISDEMRISTLAGSLKLLCKLLEKHYGKKAILLIDEYDVPLARAHAGGYYDRMISLIRSFLGAALKTNASLEFAALTGCLRISKESIFTGLNNLWSLLYTTGYLTSQGRTDDGRLRLRIPNLEVRDVFVRWQTPA